MSWALKLALGPVLWVQGRRTRARMPRLPEAAGPREGRAVCSVETGCLIADEPEFRLLITGDSSAAGVGVEHQHQALAGQLAEPLAQRLQRPVRWQLLACSGLNTAQTLNLLQASPPQPAEVAVVVTGVNDVTALVRPGRALRARAELAQWLRAQGLARHVVFTPVPPIGHFSGLPQPLRFVLGLDAQRHQRALQRWAVSQHNASLVTLDLPFNPGVLASDGFHPGPKVYRIMGRALAAHIEAVLTPRLH